MTGFEQVLHHVVVERVEVPGRHQYGEDRVKDALESADI